MTKHLLPAVILFLSWLAGCSRPQQEPDIEKALVNTLQAFPQLPKGPGLQSNYYQLVRSVTMGNGGPQLQLRSMPRSADDPQSIIIIINPAGEIGTIPFFSNTYRDYWQFRFDTVMTSIPPTHTTFEKELKRCLAQLRLFDTRKTARKLMSEMFLSLLHCRQITDSDSLNLQVANQAYRHGPAEKNCFERLTENWKALYHSFHPSESATNYNAYWDDYNHRVYQFNVESFRWPPLFSMIHYRLDCVSPCMDL